MNFGKAWSVLQKADKVDLYPFPHIVIENALPYWLYDHLKATRPKITGKGSNKRYDWRAQHALNQNLHPIWEGFIKYHCSEQFYKEVDELFGLGLKGDVGMRFRDKTPIRLDCQISINTPNEGKPERVCIWHRDNPETKWAGLLYMGNDDAGLELYDCPSPEFFGKRRVSNAGEPVKTVPFKDNTFLCFENVEHAIHAPEPRTANKTREFVNFCIDA